MLKLKGVYPALVTPLTPEEDVDKAGMRKVVRYCVDAGVHGVVVMGSTGEFPGMTDEMRHDAIETVLDEVGGKVPVLIGCGDTGTKKTILQVKHAATTKADAVLVALPYYFPLDQPAVIRHYTMVADASPLPVVLYNFPQMTKIAMTPETVAKLAAHPNIIGLKDSAGDYWGTQRFIEVTTAADFDVMLGNPALGVGGYLLGATGGIFAGCSLAPKLCADVYTAFIAGDLATAIELQKKASLIPIIGSFGTASAVIKLGLNKMGICGTTTTAPISLAPGQEEKIFAWMRSLGLPV